MENSQRQTRFLSMRNKPFSKDPQEFYCPKCELDIVTRTETETSALQHSLAAILCCLSVTLIFAWVPYLVPNLKNVYHYCPNCYELLGCYSHDEYS